MKLLVVDDEAIVLQGICSINWQAYNIEIVGVATNGREALQQCLTLQPDIVLSDICMPLEDGLAFANKLHEIRSAIHVIILTGYIEKEYMLSAIHAQVCDYLVKPVTPSQIIDAVLKTRDEILRERDLYIQNEENKKLIVENISFLQTKFIEQLLYPVSSANCDHIQKKARHLGLSLSGPYYGILCFPEPKEEVSFLLQELSSILNEWTPAIVTMNHRIVIVLNFCHPISAHVWNRFLSQIRIKITGPIIFSSNCSCLTDIAKEWEKIDKLLAKSIWLDETPIHTKDLIQSTFSSNKYEALRKDLLNSIRSHPDQAIANLNELFKYLNRAKPDNQTTMSLMDELYYQCAAQLGSIAKPLICTNWMQYKESLLQLLSGNKQAIPYTGTVGRILRYIMEHYTEELTLEQTARSLYLSSAYLSHMLKQKTDRSFTGWLRYFRIQKAKELLVQTDMKIYEISDALGYNSYKVFTEQFFKETGNSTKEYRAAAKQYERI